MKLRLQGQPDNCKNKLLHVLEPRKATTFRKPLEQHYLGAVKNKLLTLALRILPLLVLGACQSPEKPPQKTAVPAVATAAPAAPRLAVAPAAPPAPDSMQLLKPFVPVGYQVLFTVAGDLNRDAWPDRVAVLDTLAAVNDSTSTDDRAQIQQVRRPLLLLLGTPGGTRYRLAGRNYAVIDCADCAGAMGGDPFQQVVIKKGYFSVESYGGSAWRWFVVTTFKYDPADQHWYLHRVGHDSFHAADPDKVTHQVSTPRDFGRIRFEKYAGDR